MIELKIEAILEYLRGLGLEADIQEETQQVFFINKVGEADFPVFIRVYDEQQLLQILTFMPCTVQEKALGESARLLHMLNKELDLPGFGMDESAGVLFYRMSLPFFATEFDEEILEGLLKSVKELSGALYPTIEKVASGAETLSGVLK